MDMELQELAQVRDNESFIQEFDQISDDSDVSYGGKFMPVSYTHLTLPTSDLV